MRKKRKLSIMLICIITVLMNFTMLKAEEGENRNEESIVDGEYESSETAKEYIETEEDLALDLKKLNDTSNLALTKYKKKKLAVPVFKQTTSYYCGPATVKQVIHYLTGKSSSQTTYAKELGTTKKGTDMTKIPAVLNKHIITWKYTYKTINNIKDWKKRVSRATKLGVPVILDIKSKKDSGWKYRTNGHFLCTSGYDDQSSICTTTITDPHYKYAGTYTYKTTTVYKVNRAHFRHAIIW